MKPTRTGLSSLLAGQGRLLNGPICISCRKSIAQRRHASSAAAVAGRPFATQSVDPPVDHSPSTNLAYRLRTGVVLSRPPQITRDLTSFEKSFYLYQRRLNERLALPFRQYFYFRKQTPAILDWKRKVNERQTPARDIGKYNPYADEGWNDELLVGAKESEPEYQAEVLLQDSIIYPVQKDGEEAAVEAQRKALVKPLPRVTEADRKNDQRSLNRSLQRTLYLLVQNERGHWTFPTDTIIGRESLYQAAERILVQSGGLNMNTWIVGNSPVGFSQFNFHKQKATANEKGVTELGEKTFFMKGRIMAGQANIEKNSLGLKDFKWLAKDEIEKTVLDRYWAGVKNLLPER
ncbi:Ribosomal protein L46 [Venturia nashicola]|nr:Ribosomal protein L46 [Venturia nashicola]